MNTPVVQLVPNTENLQQCQLQFRLCRPRWRLHSMCVCSYRNLHPSIKLHTWATHETEFWRYV